MITFIVFVSVMLVYVAVIFFRGIYREKKDNKIRKSEDEVLEDDLLGNEDT